MEQNYFVFRDKIYKQCFDTAIGNSLTGFIANFETTISKDQRFPSVWIRYIDDVFVIMNKRKEEILTLTWLYSLKYMMKFLEFDIYRKPKFTGRLIPQL